MIEDRREKRKGREGGRKKRKEGRKKPVSEWEDEVQK